MMKIKREGSKRRPASPVPSDCSERRATQEWITTEEAEGSKRRRTDQFPDVASSTSAFRSQNDSNSSSAHSSVESTMQGIPTPPDEDDGESDSRGRFEPPAELMNILSSRGRNTRLFQASVDEMIDLAFTQPTEGPSNAPGLEYIDRVIGGLQSEGCSDAKVKEVEKSLNDAWRHRMATFIGEMITDADELRATFNGIVAASPFRPGHNGFIFRPKGSAPLVASEEVADAGNSGHEASSTSVPAERSSFKSTTISPEPRANDTVNQFKGPDVLAEAIIPVKHEPCAIAESRTETGRPEAATAGPSEDASRALRSAVPDKDSIYQFKKQFPHSFDAFFYHIKQYRDSISDSLAASEVDGTTLEQRARALYDTLDSAQKESWRAIYRQLRKGDSASLDGLASRDLLIEQDIAAKLQLFPSQAAQAFFVPFVCKDTKPIDARKRVALVVNTPDMPAVHATAENLHEACDSAFGRRSLFRGVEQWSDHVWTAIFNTPASADRAKGMAVNIDGTVVQAEHVHYWQAPDVFIADFSAVDVNADEIAVQVARAFGGSRTQPVLYKQHPWKLYSGPQYLIVLPWGSEGWMRFYVPMRLQNLNGWHMACFKPLNKFATCMCCRERHDRWLCPHAKKVDLSLVS